MGPEGPGRDAKHPGRVMTVAAEQPQQQEQQQQPGADDAATARPSYDAFKLPEPYVY